MDENGYPEDDELNTIQRWPADDPHGLMAYVRELWSYPDYWTESEGTDDIVLTDSSGKHTRYQISTGGWSGNEDLIGAMESNHIFWVMNWYSVRRGGHYEFRIPNE